MKKTKTITTVVSLLKIGWNEKTLFSNKPDVVNRFIMIIPILAIILGLMLLIIPDLKDLIGCNWYGPVEYSIFMFSMNVCSLAVRHKQENTDNILLIERIDKIHFLFARILQISVCIIVINLILWIVFSLILRIY